MGDSKYSVLTGEFSLSLTVSWDTQFLFNINTLLLPFRRASSLMSLMYLQVFKTVLSA